MKKLTAMLLSLMMCFSLLAIPAQAAFIPDPDGGISIIDVGKGPVAPGDDDPDEPGTSELNKLPGPADEEGGD